MSLEAVLEKMEQPQAAMPAAVPEAKPEQTPAEVPPQEETPKEQPPEAEPQTPEAEPEPDLEAIPETSGDFPKYKELYKDHPDLRNIIGREKAFSELAPNGSFQELRQIVERIPSLADAEQLVADAESKRTLGQTFRDDPIAFTESLKESDSLAYQNLVVRLPEVLAENDPKLYTDHARTYSNRVISNILAIAQQQQNQELFAAAQMVAQFLGIQPGQTVQPGQQDSEADRLRKQLAERDQADAESRFASFWNQTDDAIIGNCIAEIETTLKKALPSAPAAQLERMKKEVWEKTLETMNAQPQTRAQIDTYRLNAQKGRQGIADHKAIVDFGTRRAKLVIPNAAKAVISEWSKQILQLSNDLTTKKKGIAASTKDVGTGPQGTTSAAASANPGNGQKRGVESIFKQLETGNYVKR